MTAAAGPLRLSTDQHEWLLRQERTRLAGAIVAVLGATWPALAHKLGDRVPAFVEAALDQGHRHGLHDAAHLARYVNLWCVWGPAFEDKPGFEWAAEILADGRRDAAVKVQQLAMRSRDELSRRGGSLSPEQFDAADMALEATAEVPEAAPWLESTAARAQPRQACDLHAFDLALGDQSWRQEYRLALSGQQVLVHLAPVVAAVQRYRTDRPQPPGTPAVARQIAALAFPPARGAKAWLHLSCATEAVCDPAVHPRVEIKSDLGMQVLAGASARLVKVPLYLPEELARTPAAAAAAQGVAPKPAQAGQPVSTVIEEGGLCRERPPRYVQIAACTCGLRSAGAPLGAQEAVVSLHPAEQWLAEFKTLPQPTWQWPQQGARELASPPLVRLERDGQSLPGAGWVQGWSRLAEAFVQGVDAWHGKLLREEVLLAPHIDAVPALMQGLAACTWGAREVAGPEGSIAILRAQLIARLVACATDLTVRGELRLGGAVARLALRSRGRALLEADVLRESAEPALPALLQAVKTAWRHPFEVELEGLASPELAIVSQGAGGQAGALAGEAGLRPRPDGQGWQWYLQLRLEPCTLSLSLWDPIRGQRLMKQPLWPALTLVDWSVG